jgi:hypothetical protein
VDRSGPLDREHLAARLEPLDNGAGKAMPAGLTRRRDMNKDLSLRAASPDALDPTNPPGAPADVGAPI